MKGGTNAGTENKGDDKLTSIFLFLTSASLQGFGALEGMNGVQKFQIHRDDRSTDRLPAAHTCFNQLDLPAYEVRSTGRNPFTYTYTSRPTTSSGAIC